MRHAGLIGQFRPKTSHRHRRLRRDLLWHARCFVPGMPVNALIQLNQRLYWNKKMRIALLALATYLALC